MNRKIREIMSARENGESGFTLIELLVVIIIIGILASIAIPIFMNQQKTARDSATTSDVKNVATNVQSALVRYPDATEFKVDKDVPTGTPTAIPGTAADTVTDDDGDIAVYVGDGTNKFEVYKVSLSKGTHISIEKGTENGTFIVKGWNTSGKSYDSSTRVLTYNSATGGISN